MTDAAISARSPAPDFGDRNVRRGLVFGGQERHLHEEFATFHLASPVLRKVFSETPRRPALPSFGRMPSAEIREGHVEDLLSYRRNCGSAKAPATRRIGSRRLPAGSAGKRLWPRPRAVSMDLMLPMGAWQSLAVEADDGAFGQHALDDRGTRLGTVDHGPGWLRGNQLAIVPVGAVGENLPPPETGRLTRHRVRRAASRGQRARKRRGMARTTVSASPAGTGGIAERSTGLHVVDRRAFDPGQTVEAAIW